MSRSLTHDEASRDDRSQFRAFIVDDETRQIVDQVVKDLVIPHAKIHKGGIRTSIDFLSEHRSPRILIVDLSGADLPLSAVNDLAEVCEPGVTVIALGDRNDVGIFRELINNGISDYLVKPLTPTLLQKSLLSSVDGEQRSRQTSRLGRLVSIMGARGGVGATTMATALAYHISEYRRRRVALVDFDLRFGTVALALDLEPSHGFREAMENSSRIDSLYVERTMTKFSDTLFVLSAEESIEEEIQFDNQSVELLIEELRAKFHYVIVDLPRYRSEIEKKIFEDSSHMILVTDLSLAGMRDSLRLLHELPARNAACQISVVANRCGEHRQGEIPSKEFEKGIGRKLTRMIPFDAKSVAASMNIGKPIASIRTAMSPGIAHVSEILCGGSGQKSERGFLKKLLPGRGD